MEKIITLPVCKVVKETERAYLVDVGKTKSGNEKLPDLVWLPKSQCDWDGEEMQLPEWLAMEKGLV